MPSRLDISTKPGVYGWAAIIDFTVNSTGGFRELGEAKASLLWSRDLILTIEPQKIHPLLSGAGTKGYRLTVEAADTASEAEELGFRLAYALLTVAIERSWGMSLSWPDQPLPCRVVDRTASKGVSVQAFASFTSHIDTSSFVDAIDSAFEDAVPYRILLSMELCASSRFENDNRAKLIMLVSAFEALATQRSLSPEIDPLINRLKTEVAAANLDESTSASVIGQIDNLRRESVRSAIRSFMKRVGLDQGDVDIVEEAYLARSKILHEGKRIPEIGPLASSLDMILRRIYRDYEEE